MKPLSEVSKSITRQSSQSKHLKNLGRAILQSNQEKFNEALKEVIKHNLLNALIPSIQETTGSYRELYENVPVVFLAAYTLQEKFLKILLEKGANGDFYNKKIGCTVMHLAAQKGWADIVEILIKQKVDIDKMALDGRTPLFMATKNEHLNVIKLLCANGADITQGIKTSPGDKYYTPLYMSLYTNNVSALMYMSGSINETNKDKYKDAFNFTMYMAYEAKNNSYLTTISNIVKIRFGEQNPLQNCKNFMLLRGVITNSESSVREALTNGAEIDALVKLDTDRATVLHVATQLQNEKMVSLLLQLGANPSIPSANNQYPILAAFSKGNFNIIEFIIQSTKFDVNTPLKRVRPEIENTCDEDNVIYKAILNLYCLPLETAEVFITPLHYALIYYPNRLDLLTAMLDMGANPNINVNGLTAFHIAIASYQDFDMLKLLIVHKADLKLNYFGIIDPLHFAIALNNQNAVAIMIEYNHLTTEEKNKLLPLSYILNKKAAAELLISLGADPNIICPDGTNKTIGQWITSLNSLDVNKMGISSISSSAAAKDEPSIKNISSNDSAISSANREVVNTETTITSSTSPGLTMAASSSSSSPTSSMPSFYSSSEISMSSRKYLREVMKLDDAAISALMALNNKSVNEKNIKHSFFREKKESVRTKFTWCDRVIESSDNSIKEMESKTQPNCFYWFPPDDVLLSQGCDAALINLFKSTVFKFDGKHVKKLDDNKGEYQQQFKINGKDYLLQASHELKVTSQEDRLLIFPLISDDGKATMYIPVKYLPRGLHSNKDRQATASATKVLEFNIFGCDASEKQQKIKTL